MHIPGGPFVVVALAETVYSAHGQPLDPTTVLAAARDALGGEKSLSAVKTFTATGRTRQVRGNNLVPIEFETLTFRYTGLGEAPEGHADVLDVAGPANFSARFLVQRATHLPMMLMWQVPATTVVFRMPGQALPNPVPPGAVVAVKRAMAGETIEETTFDRIRISARIDPRKFETPK